MTDYEALPVHGLLSMWAAHHEQDREAFETQAAFLGSEVIVEQTHKVVTEAANDSSSGAEELRDVLLNISLGLVRHSAASAVRGHLPAEVDHWCSEYAFQLARSIIQDDQMQTHCPPPMPTAGQSLCALVILDSLALINTSGDYEKVPQVVQRVRKVYWDREASRASAWGNQSPDATPDDTRD